MAHAPPSRGEGEGRFLPPLPLRERAGVRGGPKVKTYAVWYKTAPTTGRPASSGTRGNRDAVERAISLRRSRVPAGASGRRRTPAVQSAVHHNSGTTVDPYGT